METLSVAVMTVVLAAAAYAQSPAPKWFSVGVNAGYGMAFHHMDSVSCQGDCQQFTGGTGGGMYFGLSFDWNATEHFGLSTRARYALSSLSMTKTVSGDSLVKDQNGNIVDLVRDHMMNFDLPRIMADVTARYTLEHLHVNAGMAVGILLNPTWEYVVSIKSPGNVAFANNSRDTALLPLTAFDSARKTQVYITAGASYDVPLRENLALEPEVRVNIPLTKIWDSRNWKETLLEFGVALKYSFGVPPPIAPAAEPERGRGK